ncbi:hypothetical protein FSP39_003070 [Pinctada imbricata]|uniref:Soluble Rieske-type ferredoxin domain-containing protein n=1 Tax=Pinctada imbricata TaxID=66713 RepID=A0AA89C0B7_PINIB|nr:hypothetical protein FSP39_003070 [Pinctada imbricata]
MERTNKKRFQLENRDFILVKSRGSFYVLDSFCYRMTWEVNRALYVHGINTKSEWTLVKWIYQAIDPYDLTKPPKLKCSSQKQRTHDAIVRGGAIYVNFTENDGSLSSDQYNSLEYREKFNLN